MTGWQAVSSSMISGVMYDAGAQELHVRFKSNGTVYVYGGVPPQDAEDLASAPSAGSFFNDNIKDVYPSRRV